MKPMVTAVAALGMALVACTGAEKVEPPDEPTQIGAATTCRPGSRDHASRVRTPLTLRHSSFTAAMVR